VLHVLINIANVLYTVSYSVRDILWLRILTVAGIAFTIPYYYLQPTPLLVPIGWDVAFAALNLYWIAKLLLERRPVKLTPGRTASIPSLLSDLHAARDGRAPENRQLACRRAPGRRGDGRDGSRARD
jgi:hypothetical protein